MDTHEIHEIIRKNALAFQGGRTRTELAEVAGRSKQWITGVLNGRRRGSRLMLSTLETLARALEISPYQLLLPIVSESDDRSLIFSCYHILQWVDQAVIRIRQMAQERGDKNSVLRAVLIGTQVREVRAGVAMLMDQGYNRPVKIVDRIGSEPAACQSPPRTGNSARYDS